MDNMRSIGVGKLSAGNVTATGAGAELSLKNSFLSPAKREMMAVLTAFNGGGNVASDTYALDVKLQESSTTVDSDFTDISGGAFTQITEAAASGAPETIFFMTKATSQYIREYHTVTGGTGTCTIVDVCNLHLVKRMA